MDLNSVSQRTRVISTSLKLLLCKISRIKLQVLTYLKAYNKLQTHLVDQSQLLFVGVIRAGRRPRGEAEILGLKVVEDEALLEEVVTSGEGQISCLQFVVGSLHVPCNNLDLMVGLK